MEKIKVELSRQRMRERTLNQFKHIRTCILARELCLLVRTNRAAFSAEDAREHRAFIAKLCDEAGCKEQSDLCSKASECPNGVCGRNLHFLNLRLYNRCFKASL